MRPGLKRPACNFILDPYQKVGISSHSSLPSASRGRISCKSSTLPPLLTHPLSPFSSSRNSRTHPASILRAMQPLKCDRSYHTSRPLHNYQPRSAGTGCSYTQSSHPEIEHLRATEPLPLSQSQPSPNLPPSIEHLPQNQQPPPTLNRAAPSAGVPQKQ